MFKIKTKAFTLFESVVAITIISIALGIGTTVYSNIVNSERSIVNFESKSKINSLFYDVKSSKQFFPKSYQFESFDIVQNVMNYKGIENLYKISFDVIIAGKTSFTKNYLLYDPES